MAKAPLVKEIIDHHQYYRPPDTPAVAVLFRDADIMDFSGRDRCCADVVVDNAREVRTRSSACGGGDSAEYDSDAEVAAERGGEKGRGGEGGGDAAVFGGAGGRGRIR